MKRIIYIVLCIAPVKSLASDAVLESVDLTEIIQSSQGGYASLSISKRSGAKCRIDVVIFGEIGQQREVFLFNEKLLYASKRSYRYSGGLKNANRMYLENTIYLPDKKSNELKVSFNFYKSLFKSKSIRRCV